MGPDVPLPKMKSILNVIARPAPRSSPRRTPKSETYKSFDPESGTVESTPLMDERQLHSPDCPSEDRLRKSAPAELKRWTICHHHHHPLRRKWKRKRRTSSVWPIRSVPPLKEA